jgi:chaperonin GroES
MKVRPLGDRILVERLEEESTTPSGIVLPESAKEKSQRAKVVRVGDGQLLDSGERAKFQVKEGDTVLLSKWGGTEINVDNDDKEYLMLSESDVLAVLNA